ncbi:M23 family metallopeptidase [Dactylosporangium aurantiacum]|uniref:M23 family metallopeptidase n=1 Tax=Dactylosporangium aurantiacum TaxID=35754 RepID=A0A9Q9IT77_9ACTN|nr:M23 family metallopeptidase [Dactylosporangium aurantiacum]
MRTRLAGVVVLVALGVAGCGGDPDPTSTSTTPGASSSPGRQVTDDPSGLPPSPGASGTAAGASPGGPAGAASGGQAVKHAFPVQGKASYSRTHHDYPASDIIAACGLTAVSPVDGTVLEVTRTDTYQAKVNDGATRGGLSVSILGGDGVRYYMSHFSSIDQGVEAGTPVRAGQPVAKVGRTGDASACHIHFGLSPACQKTGDWWTRRGVIWPWAYLDAWKAGTAKSPVADVEQWQRQHGCPTKPLVNP